MATSASRSRRYLTRSRVSLPPLGHWIEEAACAPWRRPRDLEPGDWQPDEVGSRTRRAREVCRGCPVRPSCLRHAELSGEPAGIWGGLDPEQRQRHHRRVT
ncbi:WhiB family transcriptional regulator [Crossiella sp. S99.1]|nr:WhiB family transcriptional regulator [Crossiella sp. S99.1]MCK2240968.1 WhiB family transcriptional regulator [Crossiella sp. S99.2]MCK2253888.1 WhiB family transcriptional regulator [Crossiella sp. S99.1]